MLLSKIVEKYGIKHINDDIKICLTPSSLFSTKGNCNLTLINLILSMRLDVLLLAFKKKNDKLNINLNDSIKNFDKLISYKTGDITFNKNNVFDLNTIKINSITEFNILDINGIDFNIQLKKDDTKIPFVALEKETVVINKSKSYEKIKPRERDPIIEIKQNLIDSIKEIF